MTRQLPCGLQDAPEIEWRAEVIRFMETVLNIIKGSSDMGANADEATSFLRVANNLSDVASVEEARANLNITDAAAATAAWQGGDAGSDAELPGDPFASVDFDSGGYSGSFSAHGTAPGATIISGGLGTNTWLPTITTSGYYNVSTNAFALAYSYQEIQFVSTPAVADSPFINGIQTGQGLLTTTGTSASTGALGNAGFTISYARTGNTISVRFSGAGTCRIAGSYARISE